MTTTRIVFCVVLLAIVFLSLLFFHNQSRSAMDTFGLQMQNATFQGQTGLFRALLLRSGAAKAQEALHAEFPGTARGHLLARQAGIFLFDSEGARGIASCLPYFEAGCAEGFVTASVTANGSRGIKQLLDACQASLEHSQALHCFYALGEGLGRYEKHDAGAAVAGCKTIVNDSNAEQLQRCFRGVFEPYTEFSADNPGAPFPESTNKSDDPMYPCNEKSVVDLGAHDACWQRHSEQTLNQIVYQKLSPTIEKVTGYCEHLPTADKEVCLTGLASQIQFKTGTDMGSARGLCAQMGESHIAGCMEQVATRAYYYDDLKSDPTVFLRACESYAADTELHECDKRFFGVITNRYTALEDQMRSCMEFNDDRFQQSCISWMKNPPTVSL